MSGYQFFNRKDPQKLADFKGFVVNVKKILFFNKNEESYTITTRNIVTNDRDLIRKTQISNGDWLYIGLHFNKEFLARSACFMFHNTMIWEMERTSEQIAWSYRDAVNGCLREALANFDIDNPWHRPEYFISSTGLQYLSRSTKQDAKMIILDEAIRDPYGLIIYATQCRAGFTG